MKNSRPGTRPKSMGNSSVKLVLKVHLPRGSKVFVKDGSRARTLSGNESTDLNPRDGAAVQVRFQGGRGIVELFLKRKDRLVCHAEINEQNEFKAFVRKPRVKLLDLPEDDGRKRPRFKATATLRGLRLCYREWRISIGRAAASSPAAFRRAPAAALEAE